MGANDVQLRSAKPVEGKESSGFAGNEMEMEGGELMAGPDSSNLKQLQAAANASSQVSQLKSLQEGANASPQVQESAQLKDAVKNKEGGKEKAPENKNGLPAALRSGIESLSGMDMSDVKVHYNSSKPAQLQAHAYAQGNQIFIGAGQEQHLPHEAWHVVQQRQGRVKANAEADGNAINNDPALEQEADTMGAKALQLAGGNTAEKELSQSGKGNGSGTKQLKPVVQRKVLYNIKTKKYYSDMDPSVDFDTQLEAEKYEDEMDAPDPISGGRAPTIYTYMCTKSHCKMSSRGIPQGPHTIGYSALTNALFNAKISLENLIAEQVPSPENWCRMVVKEFNDKNILNGKTETSLRLLRAYRAYNGLWQLLMKIANGKSKENPIDVIHELIQMGPYAVYGYVNPSKIKKKHLKNKGENSNLNDPKNIDRLGKFKDQKNYQSSIDNRLELLDDDFDEKDMMEESMSDDGEYDVDEFVKVNGTTYSYQPDEIASDGDCFFNSMIEWGFGANVAALRLIAYQNGGQNTIRGNGIWANENDITAIANHYGIRIQVASLGLDGKPLQVKTYGNGGTVYRIVHIYGGHYTPLYDV